MNQLRRSEGLPILLVIMLVASFLGIAFFAIQSNTDSPSVLANATYPPFATTAPEQDDSTSTRDDNDVYYLYILDRDGAPVREFQCIGWYTTDDSGATTCERPDGKITGVSAAVPIITLPERIPLKGQER